MFVAVGHTAVPVGQTRGCGLVVGGHTAALVRCGSVTAGPVLVHRWVVAVDHAAFPVDYTGEGVSVAVGDTAALVGHTRRYAGGPQ